ncbi:hypothetical protein Cadr_000030496 [Camelus dromedarius]|uniref:Uncharacterized protein n=1 Tax=Camelus dromedarius TaxID=9838 RepID=A0A5N4BYC6_CAMDR|nr:hypothetical protein Cadr_000030496 [Camelus dromedarius]
MRAQAPPEQEKRLQDDLARGRSRPWAQLQLPRPVSERAATSSVRPHASPGEGDPFSFTESNVPPMELTTRRISLIPKSPAPPESDCGQAAPATTQPARDRPARRRECRNPALSPRGPQCWYSAWNKVGGAKETRQTLCFVLNCITTALVTVVLVLVALQTSGADGDVGRRHESLPTSHLLLPQEQKHLGPAAGCRPPPPAPAGSVHFRRRARPRPGPAMAPLFSATGNPLEATAGMQDLVPRGSPNHELLWLFRGLWLQLLCARVPLCARLLLLQLWQRGLRLLRGLQGGLWLLRGLQGGLWLPVPLCAGGAAAPAGAARGAGLLLQLWQGGLWLQLLCACVLLCAHLLLLQLWQGGLWLLWLLPCPSCCVPFAASPAAANPAAPSPAAVSPFAASARSEALSRDLKWLLQIQDV